MKLYSGKIPVIGAEIVKTLRRGGDIAVIDRAEAELDVQAVLKEYLRLDKEITEKAKDLLQKRNLPYEQFGKVKRALAGEKGFGLGDDGARVDDQPDDRVVHAVAARRGGLRRGRRPAQARWPTS